MAKPWPSEESSSDGSPALWVVSLPGLSEYRALWDLQKRLWRLRHDGEIPDTLLLLEHSPVVTLGKNARREHLLLPEASFRERGIDVIEVDRGGDVTYHGPGQLVGYWIVDLRCLYTDVHRYLRQIEETLIQCLDRFGIHAERSPGATGVWVGTDKIAAMGMHLSHWVSTHGFALNVTTDLTPFSWILPCGLIGRGVTSMERVLGTAPRREPVEEAILQAAVRLFQRRPIRLRAEELHQIAFRGIECSDPHESGASTRSKDAKAPWIHTEIDRSPTCPV